MDIDGVHIQALVDRPAESLAVELKTWITPDTNDGISKIVRGVLALRNHGGGYLVIGFDDKTLQPDAANVPADVRSLFHIDKIQGLISRFASEPFEVSVVFPERAGQVHPVIVVPGGVKTLVASKSDLYNGTLKLVGTDDVYVRSLRSNNTPSTTKIGWKDWPELLEVCFDNREADVGRFLRRHLVGLTSSALRELAIAVLAKAPSEPPSGGECGGGSPKPPQDAQPSPPAPAAQEALQKYLEEGEQRYLEVVRERSLKLPEHGSWQVALFLSGKVPPHTATREFLSLLASSNPNYTGWPVWLDSRSFGDQGTRPYVFGGSWEALISFLGSGFIDHLDFMRLDPRGRFYLRRALQDDISGTNRAPKPLTALDFGLAIIRTAEATAVGLGFAKGMGCDPADTVLSFAFRWTRLRGRELDSWAQPGRFISPGRKAYQDEVTTFVNVPLDAPLSSLTGYVEGAVQPLFSVFDGFRLGHEVFDDLTRRLVERRLQG